MDDHAEPAVDDPIESDVEAAFSLVSDETRLAILRALFDADEPLSFSALRERVGVADSGQFNYHLGKLTDHFVERTEEGYKLRVPGELLLGAVIGGAYGNATVVVDPVPVDSACPDCGGELAASYEDMHLYISCLDCEVSVLQYPAPPGILQGRDRETLPAVFSRYTRSVMDQITGGVCPLCLGPTDPDVDSVTDEHPPNLDYRCRRCDKEFTLTVGITLVDHPEVRSFVRDRGIDPVTAPVWDLDPLLLADQRQVEDGDAAVEATVRVGDDTLLVRLDEHLAVIETRRE